MPQIEGLTDEDILELAKTSPNALKHLPDERDWDGLNRKLVADISIQLSAQNLKRSSRML